MLDSVREAVDFINDAKDATVPDTVKAKVIEGLVAYLRAIEQEIEERYVELPKDADGVPIHVGDSVVVDYANKKGVRTQVMLVEYNSMTWLIGVEEGLKISRVGSERCRHEPTVRDLLEEMYSALDDSRMPGSDRTYDQIMDEYAAKLQLKSEGDE